MIKVSKFTLDTGESSPVCVVCTKPIELELAESSVKSGYMHFWCASSLEDNSDVMAFMDDAREYAKSKGE